MFASYLRQLKPLRVLLGLGALICVVFAPRPGTRISLEGIEIFTTLILPTVAPLIFLVLLLDALMAKVWMHDSEPDKKPRFRLIMRYDLLLALLLCVIWVPYFIRLWSQ